MTKARQLAMLSIIFDPKLFPLALLFIGSGVAIYVMGVLVFSIFSTESSLAINNDIAGNKMAVFEPMVSIVMVFAITLCWLQYGEFIGQVQKETTKLTLLARSAETMPNPTRKSLLAAISNYALAIAGPEWKAMAEGGRSSVTEDALGALVSAYAAANASTPRELQHLRFSNVLVRELVAEREFRLEASTFPLGDSMLNLLYAAVFLSIVISWFLGLPSLRIKLVMGSIFVASQMVVLMFIYVLLTPLTGPAAVSNDAYLRIAKSVADDLVKE
jgi:hypothetical protein